VTTGIARLRLPRRVAVVAALLAALAIGGPFSGCHDDDGFYPPGPGAPP
jgi:hypothetical protein